MSGDRLRIVTEHDAWDTHDPIPWAWSVWDGDAPLRFGWAPTALDADQQAQEWIAGHLALEQVNARG